METALLKEHLFIKGNMDLLLFNFIKKHLN